MLTYPLINRPRNRISQFYSPAIFTRFGQLTFLHIVVFAIAILTSSATAQLQLNIIYPSAAEQITDLDSVFVLGRCNVPDARVYINGMETKVFPDGGFLAVSPLSEGSTTLHLQAYAGDDSTSMIRTIAPRRSRNIVMDTLWIDKTSIIPAADMLVPAGSILELSFRGTTGMNASATIPGLFDNLEMLEEEVTVTHDMTNDSRHLNPSVASGTYRSFYKIPHGTILKNAEVFFQLSDNNGLSQKVLAEGAISIFDETTPLYVRTIVHIENGGCNADYNRKLVIPKGTVFSVLRREGRNYYVHISDYGEICLTEDKVEAFTEQPVSQKPAKFFSITSKSFERKIRISLELEQPVPFEIMSLEKRGGLRLKLYGVESAPKWVRHDFEETLFESMLWRRLSPNSFIVEFPLKAKQNWGYHAYYSDNMLLVEIKKPPQDYSLKNMLICIDPGHAPEDGTIGATEFKEKDATLTLARALKKKLEEKDARVFLTRQDKYGASSQVRLKMASYLEADLFISLQFGGGASVAEGNPLLNYGSRTYYCQMHGYQLAYFIQKQLLRKLKLRNRGLYYKEMELCKLTKMPSVLVEPVLMFHPAGESLVRSEDFHNKAAAAIVDGIQKFLKQAKK